MHFILLYQASTIDNTARRFSWLKRTLRKFDEQYQKVFPTSWRMAELLCEEFCFTTRQHLIDVLEETKHTLDVETLIGALKKTIEVENELSERFSARSLSVCYLMRTLTENLGRRIRRIKVRRRRGGGRGVTRAIELVLS